MSGAQQWQSAIEAQRQRDLTKPSTGEQIGDIVNRLIAGNPIMQAGHLYQDLQAGLDPLSPEAAGRGLWTALGLGYMGVGGRDIHQGGSLSRPAAEPEFLPGEPTRRFMDPLEAAKKYIDLERNGPPGHAASFARTYENESPTQDFSEYLDHIDRLYQQPAAKPREQAPIGDPGSLSGLTRAMQVPSRFVQPEGRRLAILNKLMAHEDYVPLIDWEVGRLKWPSLTAEENLEMNRIGWSRAPEVTYEMETAPQTSRDAWKRNVQFWQQLANPNGQ
jgi:hypothetical protein